MHTTRDGAVLTLTLDHPQQLNALTRDEMHAMSAEIRAAGNDEAVKVVVLDHEGKAFCAGLDLSVADALAASRSEAEATIDAANDIVRAIVESPKPVVALVRGAVAGVAVSIVLAADLAVCHESAYFSLAFTKVGLMPDGGATALVAAAIGRARALRMALLAEPLSAAEAEAAGLISHLVRGDAFDREAARLLDILACGPAVAVAQTKEAINAAALHELDAAFVRERTGQTSLLGAADFNEGAAAFRERRAPRFADLAVNTVL